MSDSPVTAPVPTTTPETTSPVSTSPRATGPLPATRVAGSALADVHIADWTIVHVPGHLYTVTTLALEEHVRTLLTPDALVAIDLRRGTVSPEALERLLALAATAVAVGARLVFVEPDPGALTDLVAGGLTHVHESLDAAVHSHARLIHVGTGHGADWPLVPAASDATLLGADDLTGHGAGSRG